jgi:hypothetical protein
MWKIKEQSSLFPITKSRAPLSRGVLLILVTPFLNSLPDCLNPSAGRFCFAYPQESMETIFNNINSDLLLTKTPATQIIKNVYNAT